MYLLLRASADIEFKYFFWILFFIRAGEFQIPAWVAITCWFVLDLYNMLLGMVPNATGHHHGGVAFGAHVGGTLSGLALIALYKWKARPDEERAVRKQMEAREVRATAPRIILDPAKVLARYRPAVATHETPTIFLHDGAAQTGPFTLSQVQAGLHDGSISPEMQYWSEGMERWENVKDLSAIPM
jgi:hypothetical protein